MREDINRTALGSSGRVCLVLLGALLGCGERGETWIEGTLSAAISLHGFNPRNGFDGTMRYAMEDRGKRYILVLSKHTELVGLDSPGHALGSVCRAHGEIDGDTMTVERLEFVSHSVEQMQELLLAGAREGNLKTIRFAIRHGADVKRFYRTSALHVAAANSRPRVVEFLLEKGADISLLDSDQKTPLDLAGEARLGASTATQVADADAVLALLCPQQEDGK